MDKQPGFAQRSWRLAAAAACLGTALALSACAGFGLRNAPINSALTGEASAAPGAGPVPLQEDLETAIGLSFSGGGTRASAFAYGVLQELGKTDGSRSGSRSPLIDQVSLVSGVSGGSVTAAYFALRGRDTLSDFRRKFLIQDAEASLSTSVNVTNLVLLAKGGVNDRTGLPTWLDENLFQGATYADVLKPGARSFGSTPPISSIARRSSTTQSISVRFAAICAATRCPRRSRLPRRCRSFSRRS